MKRYLFTLLATLAAAVACDPGKTFEQLVPPTIDVASGADIAFKAVGGKGSIQIVPVEGTLQVQTAQSDWCHLSVSGNTINVEVDEYDGLESRYAVVEMTAGNATGKTIVHQFGVIVKDFAWKDVTVKNGKQDIVFPYDANGTTVRVSTDQNWLSFDATDEKLTIHVAENPSADYREALVHWALGTMTGTITVGQFDLAEAGLLGDWAWHGNQQPNNRDFPMEATLEEAGNDRYTLSIHYSTNTVGIDMKIEDVLLETNKLMLPLGRFSGTYTMKRTGVVLHAYPVVAAGTNRIYFNDAVTEGAVPFVLQKDETGTWKAVSDMAAFPDMMFRFEMWSAPAAGEDEHEDLSSSGLILTGMNMVKN